MPNLAVPKWKLLRELRRILYLFAYLPEFITDPIARALYRKKRSKNVKIKKSELELGKRVAIYVLWQPDHILESTFVTCQFLIDKGFSLVIVSNAPISHGDNIKLLSYASLIIQRPNFGYDFGAYQEGIITVFQSAALPEELLLINDSIWFPIISDTKLIERMRQSSADIVSPICYEYTNDPSKNYLQSYMLLVKNNVLSERVFDRFWRCYLASSNKLKTVERGEKLFSRVMKSYGYNLDSIYKWNHICDFWKELSDDELDSLVEYEIKINPKISRHFHIKKLTFIRDGGARQTIISYLHSNLWGKYILKTHPILMTYTFKIPFYKKDKSYPYQMQREVFRKLVRNGFTKFSDEIIEEISNWDGSL